MSRLLRRSVLRHHRRHPWQVGLAALGVALGVAVVVAIELATGSALEAFRVSAETVAGRTTHRVTGDPGGVPDEVFTALRVEAGARQAAPVVEGWAESGRLPGRALRILGVDPFSEAPIRPYLTAGSAGLDASALLTRPGAVVLSVATAEEAGVEPGDSLAVEVGVSSHTLTVAGLLEPSDERSRRGMRDLLVVDVSTAQELLGMEGRLSRIDLVVPEGAAGEELLRSVRGVLPAGIGLEAAGTRTGGLQEMTRAFELNLTALGLLALLFGGFLIYNTMTFSVVQRREALGALRALGVGRREIFGLVLGEAGLVGLLGSGMGLVLGVLLARGLVRLVTRTINDLYFVVSVEGVTVSPAVLATGMVLGVGATLAAALPAVVEATSTPPRATLTRSYVEERVRRLVPRAAAAGGLLALIGGVLLLLPSRSVLLGFVSLTGLVVGAALLAPLATVAVVRVLVPAFRRSFGVLGALAARSTTSALSRTAPAAAALVVAVAVTVGLGVMISSFRGSVSAWLDTTLVGDVYVAAPGVARTGSGGALPPELVDRLVELPGVRGATRYRNVDLDTRYGRITISAVETTSSDPPDSGVGEPGGADVGPGDFTAGEAPALHFTEGDPAEAVASLRAGRSVLVSEPFAFRNEVGPGSSIRLETGVGPRELRVAGVYRDYSSDRGIVMMDRGLYRRLWSDPAVSSLALYAAEGVAPDTLVRRAERVAGAETPIVARSNRALRARSLEVFDRTFAITGVLRLLAFIVAFIGILSALMALQLERGREYGVLRANGLTPSQLRYLVTGQTVLLGSVAGLLALPTGIGLALVMVRVINRRSFGWTLDLQIGWEMPLQTMALAVAGALLAGLYPAWTLSRTSPARALREE